ncbi:hypothetical protein [Natrarchaeobius oligotrophus]|uniref:Uncharacterized protein n=1 Tax=Natrarchaeobius chitinivorans TaxID=1679083 RepID=A0A3N6MLQ7_NATCH|nr:hypothetical protein [Natrarchaeobius chitinivorans]RQH02435.1 hypothetical protein EA472_03805 [Natrarchaeobius chitinivorans]
MDSDGLSPTACCLHCPHRKPVAGGCNHTIRQALIKQLVTDQRAVCPVYQQERARAMSELSQSLHR